MRGIRIFVSLVAVVASLGACSIPWSSTSGRVHTDGRDFGLYDVEPYCAYKAHRGGPTVELTMTVVHGYRSSQYATITIPKDAEHEGVDVQFPWSHVIFKPKDCSLFNTSFEQKAGDDQTLDGNAGILQLSCKVPGSNDSIDANISFVGC